MENKKQELAKKLDSSVASVFTNKQVLGFERAFMVASAIEELKILLTDEYMKPIMAMQGNKLGFKTDKDTSGGYTLTVVKNCLIEAVLMGLQPTGNQFNIIAGNTYATKEGVGELLKGIDGLSYKIKFELPRINPDKTSAAVKAIIEWSLNGVRQSETIELPIKMNTAMGTDAVLGKATRKARKWLFDNITGSELPEGDIEDISFEFVEEDKNQKGKDKKADLKSKQESEKEATDKKETEVKVNPEFENNASQPGLFNAQEMP